MAVVRCRVRGAGASRVLAAGLLVLAGCGGGGSGPDEVSAIASTATGGQSMPAGLAIQETGQPLDLAIDGGGAFVLRDPRTGALALSRLGHFDIDGQGRLINAAGWWVMALPAGQEPDTLDALVPMPPVLAQLPPVATRQVLLEANLDARAHPAWPVDASGEPPAIDFEDARTYHNATSVMLFDEQGREVPLTLYFQKVAPGVWQVHAGVHGRAVQLDAQGRPLPIVTLSFPPNGAAPINPADAGQPLPPVLVDLPALQGPAPDPGTSAMQVAIDLSTLTSYDAIFGVTNLLQDGWPAAVLNRVSVWATGELAMAYGGGRTEVGLRLALARTTVADRLHRHADWGWTCGAGCQPPVVTAPGQRLTGRLVGGALNTAP